MNDPIPVPGRLRVWLARVGGLLWLLVLAAALRALHKEWSGFHFKDLDDALARIGVGHLLLALAITVVSHLCNAIMGVVAERWLGRPIQRPWHSLGVSFISAAFSLNAGGTVLGGGAIRLRFAASQGLTSGEAGKVTLFTAAAGCAGCC
jgi:phosphatidylglycerol lysyltransferase